MTHDDLTGIALRWLKRPDSAKGPGCQLALAEVGGLFGGERCDAFGYRWGSNGGSIVVEAKVSRSDFLADAKKPHRNGEVLGMGDFRYYICPEGLIRIDDLPERWGLLWVTKRGHVKVVAGHVCCHLATVGLVNGELRKGCYFNRHLSAFWRHEANREMELGMMAHLLERLGDPEALNVRHKELYSANMKLRDRLAEHQRGKVRRNLEEFNMRYELERYRELYGALPEQTDQPRRPARQRGLVG